MFLKRVFFLTGAALCSLICSFAQVITSAQNGAWNEPATWSGGVIPDWSNCTGVNVEHQVVIDSDVTISTLAIKGALEISAAGKLRIRQRGGTGGLVINSGNVVVKGLLVSGDTVVYTTTSATMEFEDSGTFQFTGGARASIPVATWHPGSTFLINGFAGSGYIAIAYSNPWKQRFGNVVYDCPAQTAFVDFNGYLHDIGGDFTIRSTNGQALRLATTQKSAIHINGNLIVTGNSELWVNTTADSVRLYVDGNFEYRSASTGPGYFSTRGRTYVEVGGQFIVDSRGALRFCSGSADSTGVRRTTLRLHNGLTIDNGSLIAPVPGRGSLIFDGGALQEIRTRPEHYNGTFDFYFQPGSVVALDNGVISNVAGNLFVKGHLKLGSNHSLGALQVGNNGNIQTKGARYYYGGATIEYAGTTAQFAGPGHPVRNDVNLIVTTPSLTLLQNLVVGSAGIQAGHVDLATYQLSVSEDLTISGGAQITQGPVLLTGGSAQAVSANGTELEHLIIDKSSGDVTLLSPLLLGRLLEIRSASTRLESGGNLVCLSRGDLPGTTATVASLPAGSTITGDVTIQRHMSGEGRIYRYIASPVTNAAVNDLMDDFSITGDFVDPTPGKGRAPSLFFYNAGTTGVYGWNVYPAAGLAADSPLTPGRGYAAFIREGGRAVTWDITGPLNQGVIDLPVTFHPTAMEYKGWNLVGNPYAATIDWGNVAGWERSADISTVFAIRDNGEGRFHYSDGDIGDLPEPHIASGQAFWIRTSAPDPFLRVNESAKVNSSTEFFRSSEKPQVNFIQLTLTGKGSSDEVFIRERTGATSGYDLADAGKMSNDFISFCVLTTDNVPVAISAVDAIHCFDTYRLSLNIARNPDGSWIRDPRGSYTLSVRKAGLMRFTDVLLVDHYRGDTLALETYLFTIDELAASYATDRFSLVLKTSPLVPPVFSPPLVVCPGIDIDIPVTAPGNGAFSIGGSTGSFEADSSGTFRIPKEFVVAGENVFYLQGRNVCQEQVFDTLRLTRKSIPPQPHVMKLDNCQPGPVTITMSGKVTAYSWSEDDDFDMTVPSGPVFTTPPIDSAATWFVVAHDEFGCSSDQLRIDVPIVFPVPLRVTKQGDELVANYPAVDWYFENDLIVTAPRVAVVQPGIYKAAIQKDGCFQEVFHNILAHHYASAAPVPFVDHLRITLPHAGRIHMVRMLDSSGREVYQRHPDESSLQIETSFFPSGMYYIQIVDADRRMLVLKVVK